MLAIILVAFLQDPIRKLVPGQPPYFILFAGVVFGFALLGAMRVGIPLGPRMVVGWRKFMALPFQVYVMVVLLQALHSLGRFSSPMVTTLGLIAYLGPFVALALAHAFAATGGSRQVRAFFTLYAVAAAAALVTVYLQTLYPDIPIFGEVGVGIRIYDAGGVLTAYSGTYRASEIAAWHAAMCTCVVLVLATHRRPTLRNIVLALAVSAVIIALGTLTGRRKFLVMIAIFAASYIGLLGLYWKKMRAIAIPSTLVAAAAYGLFLLASDPDQIQQAQKAKAAAKDEYSLYVQRTSGVFSDVNDRFLELGLAPVTWAYNRFGLLGGGAGIGTQGVQHLTNVTGDLGAAEGGLGKIMLELGLPGLLAVAAMGWAIVRHIRYNLRQIGNQSGEHARLFCGITAILIANVASFSVATQAFGDIFVLIFLGICLGVLFAMPRVIAADQMPVAHAHTPTRAGTHPTAPTGALMLAVLTTHPIQYQVPIWRKLTERSKVPVKVYYMSDQGLKQRHDPEFGRAIAWDIDLLSGYQHEFLEMKEGAEQSSFWWLRLNQDLGQRLKREGATTLWLQGWQVAAYWQALQQARRAGLSTWLRADTNLRSTGRTRLRSDQEPDFGALLRAPLSIDCSASATPTANSI
ncbi:MAG: hypothetical protein R3D67_11985 [Hyphomicrobiaceae bacterium]